MFVLSVSWTALSLHERPDQEQKNQSILDAVQLYLLPFLSMFHWSFRLY